MKALACIYGNKIETDMIAGFRTAGLEMDEVLISELGSQPEWTKYLFVFTVGFVPEVSSLCQKKLLPCLSWIVDWEIEGMLLSPELKNPCNYIFCFERALQEQLAHFVGGRAFHLPFGVDASRWAGLCSEQTAADTVPVACVWEESDQTYEAADVMDIAGMKQYTKGYLEALLGAQEKLCGCFLLADCLGPELISDMRENMTQVIWPDGGDGTDARYAVQILANMATYRERVHLLRTAASEASVYVYGIRNSEKWEDIENCQYQKLSDREEDRADVYRNSCINLCLTHRGIRTGFTNQILEVMAVGGFVLTNFQPELTECFNIGEHLEVFSNEEELAEKIRYYLAHEEERRQIACNGRQLADEIHTYRMRAAAMFQMVFAEVMDDKEGEVISI